MATSGSQTVEAGSTGCYRKDTTGARCISRPRATSTRTGADMEYPVLFTGEMVRAISGNRLPTTGIDGNETANAAEEER